MSTISTATKTPTTKVAAQTDLRLTRLPTQPRASNRTRRQDKVDEVLLETFPASDPPSWWAGVEPTDATSTH